MNEKKLQAYASLAEVVSALAIIVSLFYVANEFRRSDTMSSREADVVLFERERAANHLLIQTPGLAEILIAAKVAPQDLSEADRLRYLAYQHDFFDSWEMGWFYHADGILDEATWAEWDEWFSAQAKSLPAFAWEENRRNFPGGEFRDHVDRMLTGS